MYLSCLEKLDVAELQSFLVEDGTYDCDERVQGLSVLKQKQDMI